MFNNNIVNDQGMGGLLGLNFCAQAITIRSDNSQLNSLLTDNSVKLKQNAQINQKSLSHQSTTNKGALAQTSFGKMVTTTETGEQTKTNSLSQETIDAAAQVTTDEASLELTKAFGQSTGTTRQTGTFQERNLLQSLDGLEESSLETTLEDTAGMSQEQEKTKSAVDATLEEIQRLHIIEQELAKANIGTAETAHQKSKEINQNQIVSETLARIKNEQKTKVVHKDKLRVEELVQQQIEEQANAIEDSNTFEQNADVLNYGNYIDNQVFTSTGEIEDQDQQLQADLKEYEKQDAEKEKLEKEIKLKQDQAKKDASDFDETNTNHLQSQAALGDISPTLIKGNNAIKVSKEPLQPSKDASKLDLSGDLPFTAVKIPAKSPKQKAAEQKQKIAEVVKNSIAKAKKSIAKVNALHQQTEKQEKKDKKKIEAAEALFKFKQLHTEPVPSPTPKLIPAPVKVLQSKKETVQIKEVKPVIKVEKKVIKEETKEMKVAEKSKVKENNKSKVTTPSTDEKDHEILQLDNLFLTVREQLVSTVTESKKHHKTHKKSKKKGKHHKKNSSKSEKKKSEKQSTKGTAPESFSLLQLGANLQTDAEQGNQAYSRSHLRSRSTQKSRLRSHMKSKSRLRQKRCSDSTDLSMDESADEALEALAHSEIKMNQVVKNSSKRHEDTSGFSSSSIEVKDVLDSEVEETSTEKVDYDESKEEADNALKRQQRLEQIALARSGDEKESRRSGDERETRTTKSSQVSINDLMGEVETDDAIERANSDESQRVVAQQQRREKELHEAAGEDCKNGGSVAENDSLLKSTMNDLETEALVSTAESDAADHDQISIAHLKIDTELAEASGDDYRYGGSNYDHDAALKSALNDMQVDVMLKSAESRHSSDQQEQASSLGDSDGDRAARSLLEESVFEGHMKHGRPASSLFLQVDSSVEAETESEAEAGAEAQVEAMTAVRAAASAQAKAATEALAALGVEQKSQIRAQDQNLIDALKRTIGQLEAKQNPAVAAAVAKKKAVNNIQKALTNKILTRLDDTQPLINVFSKMQSLSKMMPQIQDFERRLGILHQVEPILENAISTLSKVVDLSGPLGAMPSLLPPPPPPPPPPPKPAAPDLNQLKALLAQQQQMPVAAPEPAPASDDLSALLSGAGGQEAIGNLLGGAGGGSLGGLQGLLGGLGGAVEEAAPELQAPAFLAAAAPAADPLAALGLGGGGDEAALLSKLLGSGL